MSCHFLNISISEKTLLEARCFVYLSTKVTCSEWLMRIVDTYRGENNWQNGLIIEVKQVYLKRPSSRSVKNSWCVWEPP